MSYPTVCGVMLANGRAALVERALASFYAQTYPGAWLLVYDTTPEPLAINPPRGNTVVHIHAGHSLQCKHALPENEIGRTDINFALRTIGQLRNEANEAALKADILLHWDSDDWSHPNRIAEQVALLRASGKDCVGYRDMLFWRTFVFGPSTVHPSHVQGEVWLYTNAQHSYCLGTSLCYWRKTWERRLFEHLPKGPMGMGEDHRWLAGVDALGVSSLVWKHPNGGPTLLPSYSETDPPEPRMIASVHGGNSTDIMRVAIQVKDKMLKRVPEWDEYCRALMSLKGKFSVGQ